MTYRPSDNLFHPTIRLSTTQHHSHSAVTHLLYMQLHLEYGDNRISHGMMNICPPAFTLFHLQWVIYLRLGSWEAAAESNLIAGLGAKCWEAKFRPFFLHNLHVSMSTTFDFELEGWKCLISSERFFVWPQGQICLQAPVWNSLSRRASLQESDFQLLVLSWLPVAWRWVQWCSWDLERACDDAVMWLLMRFLMRILMRIWWGSDEEAMMMW